MLKWLRELFGGKDVKPADKSGECPYMQSTVVESPKVEVPPQTVHKTSEPWNKFPTFPPPDVKEPVKKTRETKPKTTLAPAKKPRAKKNANV